MSLMLSVYTMLVGTYTGMHSPYRYYAKADAEIAVYSEPIFGNFQLDMGWPPNREYLGVRIVLHNIEQKQRTVITKEKHASQSVISPDGKKVAWIAGDIGEIKVFKIYDRTTKAIQNIRVDDDTFQHRLNWTPDAKSLIYTTLHSIVFHPLEEGEVFHINAS